MQTNFFGEQSSYDKAVENSKRRVSELLAAMSLLLEDFEHEIEYDESLQSQALYLKLVRVNINSKFISNTEYTGIEDIQYKSKHRLFDGFNKLCIAFQESNGVFWTKVRLIKDEGYYKNPQTKLVMHLFNFLIDFVNFMEPANDNKIKNYAFVLSYYLLALCGVHVDGKIATLLNTNDEYDKKELSIISTEISVASKLLTKFKPDLAYTAAASIGSLQSVNTDISHLQTTVEKVQRAVSQIKDDKNHTSGIVSGLFKKFGK